MRPSVTNALIDEPSIADIKPASIRAYLAAHGWREIDSPRVGLLVFEGPLDDYGQPIIQVLPESDRAIDFGLRAAELVEALSVIENRRSEDVFRDIMAHGRPFWQRFPRDAPRVGWGRYLRHAAGASVAFLMIALFVAAAATLREAEHTLASQRKLAERSLASVARTLEAPNQISDYSLDSGQSLTFSYTTAKASPDGTPRLAGVSTVQDSKLAIKVNSSSGLVPNTVTVNFVVRFPSMEAGDLSRTFPIGDVSFTPEEQQFIISNEGLETFAAKLKTEINKLAQGSLAPGGAFPMPSSVSVTVTPVLPSAWSARPVVVAREVPVSGAITVRMVPDESKGTVIPHSKSPASAPTAPSHSLEVGKNNQ
jgi:hypothetical protein